MRTERNVWECQVKNVNPLKIKMREEIICASCINLPNIYLLRRSENVVNDRVLIILVQIPMTSATSFYFINHIVILGIFKRM